MQNRPVRFLRNVALVTSLSALLAACGGGGGDGGGSTTPPPDPGTPSCENAPAFDSTFAAIQKVIFEKRGCTQQVCHRGVCLPQA